MKAMSAPSRARRSTIARPMPRDPPVTRARGMGRFAPIPGGFASGGGPPRTMVGLVPMKIILALVLLIAAAAPAPALTLLTREKFAVFGGADGALVQVGPDRAFRTLRDPTCPTASSIRFALSRTGA